MFAIKAPVVKVVAAAQKQKSEKKAMCVFASTRSTLDFEFCFFIILFYRLKERAFLTGILGAKEALSCPKTEGEREKISKGEICSFSRVRKTRSV